MIEEKWGLVAGFVSIALWALWRLTCRVPRRKPRRSFRQPSRGWRVRSAKRALAKIASLEHPGQQFNYIRKVGTRRRGLKAWHDGWIFEEMIMLALERRGLKTEKTPYVGDGGVDGIVYLGDTEVLMQVKRYSQHIRRKDLLSFEYLCIKQQKPGLFVHTGRTGRGSRAVDRGNEGIEIVSGERMLDLLLGRPMTVFNGFEI